MTILPSEVVTPGSVPLNYIPANENDLIRCIKDPVWRLCSGHIYKIMIKSASAGIVGVEDSPVDLVDDGSGGLHQSMIVPFRPNKAQKRFIVNIHTRNVVLKARQRGFTTLICILWLDHALFQPDQRCAIICDTERNAESIFRDKILLAYNKLPAEMRIQMPLAIQRSDEIVFAHNNSSVKVAVSVVSATVHRLHISEFGKICADAPHKAEEIMGGSVPAVPLDGWIVVESTARGATGRFHTMVQQARRGAERVRKGGKLTPRDFKFHFSPWWDDEGYQIGLDQGDVDITQKDNEYFEKLEAVIGRILSIEQKRWYIATRNNDFQGDPELMWREYPGTPDEAFAVSPEGFFFADLMAEAKKQGRVTFVPHKAGFPVNTFWDIGSSAGTAVWLHQYDGLHHRLCGFIEGWDKPIGWFISQLQAKRVVFGRHCMPHDADQKKQRFNEVISVMDEVRREAQHIGGKWVTVPRVQSFPLGIMLARKLLQHVVFDEANTADGRAHLVAYRKVFHKPSGSYIAEPVKHDGHSEAADALRQLAQMREIIEAELINAMHPAPSGGDYTVSPDMYTGM